MSIHATENGYEVRDASGVVVATFGEYLDAVAYCRTAGETGGSFPDPSAARRA